MTSRLTFFAARACWRAVPLWAGCHGASRCLPPRPTPMAPQAINPQAMRADAASPAPLELPLGNHGHPMCRADRVDLDFC